jgi:transposase
LLQWTRFQDVRHRILQVGTAESFTFKQARRGRPGPTLLTNDRTLTDAQVLEAHKGQPSIEKRFEQTKTVLEIAPVLLKSEGRIEAFFLLSFLALLVQALIERDLRLAMKREATEHLPLYPEERLTAHPTADQVFRLFSLAQRQTLSYDGTPVKVFVEDLTPLQEQVLGLLGVPAAVRHRP